MPMPHAQDDNPPVSTFPDHDVITPPNKLRKAIKKATASDEDPVARAEQALAGLAVADSENPIEVARVIRSFDPCLACAVH